MARTITTVTTTAKDKLPYHFICNYCGCRNDKVADIAGISVGGRENVGGALRDLHGEPQRYREKIRAYEQRLRAGKALPNGKFDALDYSVNSLLTLGLDGKCTRCGKEQAWTIDPSSHDNVVRTGCLWVLAFNLLGGALFLVGAIVADGAARAVLMGLGGFIWLGGIVGSMIALFLRKRSATKKRLAELRAAPNDPDKLPVIDVPEAGGEWDMWNMG